MDFEKLTLGEVHQLLKELRALGFVKDEASQAQTAPKTAPFEIGKKYFIRTVTHHDLGRCVAIYDDFIVLEDASWVADDGRFGNALETGVLCEVEPFPNGRVPVGRGAIIDAPEWPHDLPRKAKP